VDGAEALEKDGVLTKYY